MDQNPWQVVHPTLTHVCGPEEVTYGPEELVVLCLVRDGRPYVRSFVEHYFALGVKHLVFLDNGSTDGTAEALGRYPKVTVLRSTLPFKTHQNAMRRYLIERFGKGRWSLCVDIDELFDYPHSDVIGLDSLLDYLGRNSYTAVVAQLLDMFPDKPLMGASSVNPNEPLREAHRFYDISDLQARDIEKMPRCPPDNTYAGDEIEFYKAGVRLRVFGVNTALTKHPLVFCDGEVRPVDPGPHWASNARVADFTCVLLHYKFLGEHSHRLAVRAVREQQYVNDSAAYKKYLKALEKTPDLPVKGESTRELGGVDELVENGFLVVSEDYAMLAHRERFEDHPERGGARDADEAIYKIRARVQEARASRFKRRIESLEEQSQRALRRRRRRIRQLETALAGERKRNRELLSQTPTLPRRVAGSWVLFLARPLRAVTSRLGR